MTDLSYSCNDRAVVVVSSADWCTSDIWWRKTNKDSRRNIALDCHVVTQYHLESVSEVTCRRETQTSAWQDIQHLLFRASPISFWLTSHLDLSTPLFILKLWACSCSPAEIAGVLLLRVLCVVQVEVSATSRLLLQRSPAERGVCVCDSDASKIKTLCPTAATCAMEKKTWP
jgi:hypothetical protein